MAGFQGGWSQGFLRLRADSTCSVARPMDWQEGFPIYLQGSFPKVTFVETDSIASFSTTLSKAFDSTASFTGVFTAVLDSTASHSINLLATFDSTASFNSTLTATSDSTASVTAALQKEYDSTASVSANLLAVFDSTASFSSTLSALLDSTASVTAALQKEYDSTASFSSVLQTEYDSTASVSANLVAVFDSTASFSSVLQTEYDSTASYSTNLRATLDSTASFSASLTGLRDSTASFSARLTGLRDSTASFSARLTGLRDSTASFSANLTGLRDSTASFSLNTKAQSDSTASFCVPLVYFHPNDISGARLWLAADHLACDYEDGDIVGVWPDSLGIQPDFRKASTPIFTENAVNSLPVVRFDGSFDSFSSACTGLWHDTNGQTVFVVYKRDAASGDSEVVISESEKIGAAVQFEWGVTVDTAYINSGGEVAVDYGSSKDAWMLVRSLYSGSDITVFRDSTAWDTASGNMGVTDSEATITYVGRDANSGSQLDGDIAEVIIYNRELTSLECGKVESALRTKYGLPHPTYDSTSSFSANLTGLGDSTASFSVNLHGRIDSTGSFSTVLEATLDSTASVSVVLTKDYDSTASFSTVLEQTYDSTASFSVNLHGKIDSTASFSSNLRTNYDSTASMSARLRGSYDTRASFSIFLHPSRPLAVVYYDGLSAYIDKDGEPKTEVIEKNYISSVTLRQFSAYSIYTGEYSAIVEVVDGIIRRCS